MSNYLFVIYIGGSHKQSFIELHDMRFVIANSIESTYESLKKSWWGTPESLHIDAWGILDYADGYDIIIKDHTPLDNENKLYFVNLGGYDHSQFTELHKNVFVVAENPSKAKVKALKQILDWELHHRDYQFEAENIIDIAGTVEKYNYYIHLSPTNKAKDFKFVCTYIPLKEI